MPKPEPKRLPGYIAEQYEVGDLAAMKPDEIVEAKLAGPQYAVEIMATALV